MKINWRRSIGTTGLIFVVVYFVSFVSRDSDSIVAARTTEPVSKTIASTQYASPESKSGQVTGNSQKQNTVQPITVAEWIAEIKNPGVTDQSQREVGIRLLRERRSALKDQIKADPERALANALTWSERQSIPPEYHQYLEQPINTRGSYGVMVANDFKSSVSRVQREIIVDDRRYEAFVYGEMLFAPSSGNRPLNGIALDDVVALSESPIRVLSAEEADARKLITATKDPTCAITGEPADILNEEIVYELGGDIHYACRASHLYSDDQWLAGDTGGIKGSTGAPVALDTWSQGPKTLLFIRVNFPDDLQEPISMSGAIDLMDRVNDWIVENSYDTTSIISTVTPLLTLPNTKAYYSEVGDGPLLTDARVVAKAAGYDTADFDLDAVRFRTVPGYSYGGKAYVRGKGCWLQSSSLGVACHEFGHNYGLWHANYWQASDDSIIGPGSHKEYGDIFDTMGSAGAGDKHFSAVHRHKIDWMGDSFIHSVSGSGTYRIHAYDIPILNPNRHYAIKIKRDYDRDYWIELRHLFANYPHVQNGVLLRWDPWSKSSGGAHLLDTTPGSPAGNSSKRDAPIIVGRTFSDHAAGIYITPVSIQGIGDQKSVDVVINQGDFSSNQKPTVSVQASTIHSEPGEDVVFTATATDPENDTLGYYWTFGDLSFGSNSPIVTNSWNGAGDYVVQCRVTDMKGGYASAYVVVEVGTHSKNTISGRITDTQGSPVEGVHVSNGTTSTSSYRGSYTDSDGNYLITELSGSYTLSAELYGYELSPLGGWSNPLAVGSNMDGIDFVAEPTAVVGLSLVDSEAAEEGNDAGIFRITRTGSTESALTVKYLRTGTASSSRDYTLTPAPSGSSPYSITIPAGSDHIDILATPNQDTSTEGTETLTLTLDAHTDYVIERDIEQTLYILDDETVNKPTISVSSNGPQADNRATESGSDQGVFTISRYGNRDEDVTVNFTFSGTATSNTDYAEPEGTVLIPAGESKVNVAFHVLDDQIVEGDESVVINLNPDDAYTLGSSSATVTIHDDDPTLVKVTAKDAVAAEGSSDKAVFLFQRFGDLTGELRIEYTTAGTATEGDDYEPLAGTVIIPAGAASTTVTLTSINDSELEGDESVALSISSGSTYNIDQPGSAVIVIQDSELPTITLSTPNDEAIEGSGNDAQFRFTRNPATSGDIVIEYQVSGSARNGEDYSSISSSTTILDGESSVDVNIVALSDAITEHEEIVTLKLVDSDNYNIGTTEPVSITIADDGNSSSVAVGFESPTSERTESNTSIQLPVVLSRALASDVDVNYSISGGSAENGTDYRLTDGTLTIDSGDTLKTIDFHLVNDSAYEADETIEIQLSAPSGAVLGTSTIHTLTIKDDDAGVVSASAIDADADENGDQGKIRISRTGGTAGDMTVYLQIAGTASSPSDYAPLPTSVVIPDGSTSVDLVVSPKSDETEELDETVQVRVTSVIAGRIGSPDIATVTISNVDDEVTLPVISVFALDDTTTENMDDPAQIRIVRSENTDGELTVNISTSGDVTPSADHVAFSDLITLADGQTETFIDVQAIGDANEEPLEELIVSISPSSTYNLSDHALATIRFVDSPFMGWQLTSFNESDIEDTNVSGPDADPDGDGLVNFLEYAFNRNPHAGETKPLVEKEMMALPGSGEQVLKITYQRRIIRPGIHYKLAASENLSQWDDNPINFVELSTVSDENGVTETVEVQALFPTLHFNKTFVDLRVIKD